MKLVEIPVDKYNDYRLDVIWDAYKWDPQFQDRNTIAKHALIITGEEHAQLTQLAEALDKETTAAENMLCSDIRLARDLRIPLKLHTDVKRMKNYRPECHIRLTRYDFHPVSAGSTADSSGWAVSEVNSDVPGGFAEASLMPQVAMRYIGNGDYYFMSFGKILLSAITSKVQTGAAIAMVHCTSYSDDRQVMQYLGDNLESMGYRVIYMAADHLRFKDFKAYCILDGNECEIDAIVRFTPLEWLIGIKPKRWQGYFDTATVSCNHPAAIFAQTKRFPFTWDVLEKRGISMATWRKLLPETLEVKDLRKLPSEKKADFIYKPALGRVGENITIKEACRDDEYEKTLRDVQRHPKSYIAQRRFDSLPLTGTDGTTYHVCIGAFCIDGNAAGYYARISTLPRIDSGAADIPVLIEGSGKKSGETACITSGSYQQAETPANPGREAYRIWAPDNVRWSSWARPVPFVTACSSGYTSELSLYRHYVAAFDKPSADTAIIIDFPAYESITASLDMAERGFRPVPLFNGTPGQAGAMALNDNTLISRALISEASRLAKLDIPDNAPPIFLLDSARMFRYKMDVSVFDNSWDLYEQDIPPAEYFINNGITKIVICGIRLNKDLRVIMHKFKKKGIKILWTDGFEEPREVKIIKIKNKHFVQYQ